MSESKLEAKDIEDYILQTNSGIIPKDLWLTIKASKGDPFAGYSPEEARRVKRKFRKLKRKLGINKHFSARLMWERIDMLLRLKEGVSDLENIKLK
tara:strand:- start:108 stop:395 length:288 start_codon:yes stop_codon:yes gene_type:complete